MTRAETLEALARRCEAGEVSCELDDDIFARAASVPLHDGFWTLSSLDYTTSLDAAMSLVPKGWVQRLSQIRFGLWKHELWKGDKSFNELYDAQGIAPTPASALTAACLRAHAAIGEGK
jgi:hypothetical protein